MIIIENTYACFLSSEGNRTEHPPTPLAMVPTSILWIDPPLQKRALSPSPAALCLRTISPQSSVIPILLSA